MEQKDQQGIEPEQQRMAEKQDSERFKDRNEECPTDKDSLRINQSQMDCDMEREAKARIRHSCPPVYTSPTYLCPPTHLFPTLTRRQHPLVPQNTCLTCGCWGEVGVRDKWVLGTNFTSEQGGHKCVRDM